MSTPLANAGRFGLYSLGPNHWPGGGIVERSFNKEVEALKLGDGDIFRGEGILAVTKALLQSGVSYVGGYQGAPVSHLIDVLVDAKTSWPSSACISRPARMKPAPPRCSAPRSIIRCAAR